MRCNNHIRWLLVAAVFVAGSATATAELAQVGIVTSLSPSDMVSGIAWESWTPTDTQDWPYGVIQPYWPFTESSARADGDWNVDQGLTSSSAYITGANSSADGASGIGYTDGQHVYNGPRSAAAASFVNAGSSYAASSQWAYGTANAATTMTIHAEQSWNVSAGWAWLAIGLWHGPQPFTSDGSNTCLLPDSDGWTWVSEDITAPGSSESLYLDYLIKEFPIGSGTDDTDWVVTLPAGDYTMMTFATADPNGIPGAISIQRVPEPATIGLLAFGGLLALLRRRRFAGSKVF